MKRRVLSMFLALVMTVSLIPVVSIVTADPNLSIGTGHMLRAFDVRGEKEFSNNNLKSLFSPEGEVAFAALGVISRPSSVAPRVTHRYSTNSSISSYLQSSLDSRNSNLTIGSGVNLGLGLSGVAGGVFDIIDDLTGLQFAEYCGRSELQPHKEFE